MTITSAGYTGTVSEAQWAALMATGRTPQIEGTASFAVSSTGNRGVSVAAGAANGYGVRVVSDAAVAKTFSTPATGGQWYLAVLRRTWGSGAASSIVFLTGTTTATTTAPTAAPTVLPTGYAATVGTQADQPLAWVWISSVSTTPVVFDARTFGADATRILGTSAGRALMATTGLVEGVDFVETDTHYSYRWLSSAWRLWDTGGIWTLYTYASGFSVMTQQNPARWMIRQGTLHSQGSAQGTFVSNTYTAVTTTGPGNPPADYRPAIQVLFGAFGQGGRGAGVMAQPDGSIQLSWNNGNTAYTAPVWMSWGFAIPFGS